MKNLNPIYQAVSLVGSLILLVCMVFATTHLGSADHWVRIWLPFVIAGAVITLAGYLVPVLFSHKQKW